MNLLLTEGKKEINLHPKYIFVSFKKRGIGKWKWMGKLM